MDSLFSMEQTDKVISILNQVSELSESEKHVLYLKLPDETDEASSKEDLALGWIRTHYVEDKDICVPKQDVYKQYRQHCETSGDSPLNSLIFGKMLKLVFPNIHDRRLGQRGKSKYCYGGLRRKESIESSSSPAKVLSPVQTKEDLDLYVLSCQLVCEWATQLLGKQFVDIRSLSEYLVSKGLSCGKTAAKFALLSGSTSPPKLFDKDRKSPNSKHHDRQILLQRKLRHNKLIREHKEKLKQQQMQFQDQYSASTITARSSSTAYSPAAYQQDGQLPTKSDIPGKKIQLRPSSVQPYVWCVSSTHADKKQVGSFTHGLGLERAAASELNTTLLGENLAQVVSIEQVPTENVRHAAEPSSKVAMRLSLLASLPPKRCHSTSVVEKQSSSIHFGMLEITGHTLEKCPSSADTNSGCEMEDGKVSSYSPPMGKSSTPIDIQVMLSSEGVSKGLSSLALVLPPSGVQRNITKMLESPVPRVSTDGLLLPQHPKRYGDSISPDRSSLTKRKCTTSLGVTKQQSLEASSAESENPEFQLPRLRPYSCPVSVDISQFDAGIKDKKSLSNHLFLDEVCSSELVNLKEHPRNKVVPHATVANSPTLLSDRRTSDDRRKNRPEQQHKKSATLCHVVQKPTVINRPKHNMHTITSCPDVKQIITSVDVSHQQQEQSSEKQVYNILNTLLSTNYDLVSDPIISVKTLPTSQFSPPLTLSYASSHTTNETSNPILQGSHLRLVTNTSRVVENPSILSSLSSRSAFVPVTSHKLQVANSALKETDLVTGVLSTQKQSAALIRNNDQDSLVPSTTASPQSVESLITDSTHILVKPAFSHAIVCESSVIPTHNDCNLIKDGADVVNMKFKKYSMAVTSTCSSSSSSSSSTLCRSGDSTSSGCESVLTTPIPAPVTEKSDALHVSSSTVSVKNSVIPTTSIAPACSTVAQCKSSPSLGCTTPVMSPHICPGSQNFQTHALTSSITPPKRASRNRFTPIRPKLGGGTNTLSPQKLGGMTTPSPQKKDMRPDIKPDMRLVSAILKEQRVKCAQDLLVNLANNYQGEVKLQMPAEFLGLSPAGKSKSSDIRVTIRSPSNSINIIQHKNLQPGSSDQHGWPLGSPTPPHKEITVIVEPVSQYQSSGHSITSPALSSCLISSTPAKLLQSLSSPVGVHNLCNSTLLPKPLISPKSQLQQTSAGSGANVIILPPVNCCLPSAQTVGSSTPKPIIVEDDKGNIYSLDQKSRFTVLPQNLQHYFKSSQSVDSIIPSDQNTSFFNSTKSLLNVSEIKGHVIGPDAIGQTYLLVPNSEPVILTSSDPSHLCKQTSPVLATTLTSSLTKSQMNTLPNVSCASLAGIIQPHATSSSAFVPEASQLASSVGQNISGQTLIQHNSASSAFHKCSSSTYRRIGSIGESVTGEGIGGEFKDPLLGKSFDCQPLENNVSKGFGPTEASGSVKSTQEAADANNDRHSCEGISGMPKFQGMRKRKASKSPDDEHEGRKRLNSDRKEENDDDDDDDVFIVKIEDYPTSKTGNENSDIVESCATSTPLCSSYPYVPTSPKCDQPDSLNRVIAEETTGDSKKIITDTETLLGMIEDSKSMTVKETIKALNELRAKQSQNVSKSFSACGIDGPAHREMLTLKESSSCLELNSSSQPGVCNTKDQLSGSRADVRNVIINRSRSARCTSVSPYLFSDAHLHYKLQESLGGPHADIIKGERTGRRHISLNLESLESDALLDTEPTLDHRLVGDIKDTISAKSDQKTSVGIAVKSARSIGLLLSSDRVSDYRSKSKQHKRDIKPQVSHSVTEITKHQINTAIQDRIKQGKGYQQNTLITGHETKPELVSEQQRSMSCVRDILQHGAKHDLLKCISTTGDMPVAESNCHNLKALSMSNLNHSSASGSKASEHPFLAQCLSVPSRSLLELHAEAAKKQTKIDNISLQLAPVSSCTEQTYAETALAKSNLPENELPGDIADFITESMSCGSSYTCDAFRGNSLTSLLADLVRNGKSDREQKSASDGQNVTVWRSISVPNTIPDIYYDIKKGIQQKDHEIFGKSYSLSHIRSQSISDKGSGLQVVDRQTKPVSSSELSSLPLQLSWERLTDPHDAVHCHLNPDNVKEKDLFAEHSSQSSGGNVSLSSGTFLSPIGPARLTRRSSVERSLSGDRSIAKTPVETLPNKCSTERSLARIRTPTERTLTKMPVDRSLTKTPLDRSLSMAAVERTSRKGRDKSPNKMDNPCRDHTTAVVLQQSTKDRDLLKHSGNRVLTKSPAEKVLSNLICESLFLHRALDGLTHQGSADGAKGDRSRNQTPMSDAGYSSVSQTPISEVGCSSVSPSPVMMSIPGMFGGCGRQELTSPATIFMPLRSDSVMSLVNNSRSNDGVDYLVGLSAQTGSQGRYLRSASDITQCLHRTSEVDEYQKPDSKTYVFDQDIIGQRPSLLQDVIDGTLLGHGIKKTSENHVIKDTLSFLDFDKFMSVQLNCIPTPPCSPSISPHQLGDTSQSPLSFSVPFSHVLPPPHSRQSWVSPTTSVSSHQMTQFSSVATISSHASCLPSNSRHIMSSSPGIVNCAGQHSPNVLPNTSLSSYGIVHNCSSPHQYNPHPSPPFTPSLQRCLASPRCPTPCSHLSLMSPCCATPCGDSNSAPNRFMPIQTSGILATSLTATQTTYIQPIRPVVTLASMAIQNSQHNLDFSQNAHNFVRMSFNKTSPSHIEACAPDLMLPVNHKQNSGTLLKSDLVLPGNYKQNSGTLLKSDLVLPGNYKQNSSTLLKSDLVLPGNHKQNSSTLLKSDATTNLDVPLSTDRLKLNTKSKEDCTIYRQRKIQQTQLKLREDHKSDRAGHPALVLSLTGGIGSVSGQGMQAGWRKDTIGPASPSSVMKTDHAILSHPSHVQYRKSILDRSSTPDTAQEQTSQLPREVSPPGCETFSMLDGSDNSFYNRNTTEGARETGHNELNMDLCGGVPNVDDGEKSLQRLPLSRSINTLTPARDSLTSVTGEGEQLLSSSINCQPSDNSDFPFSLQLAKLCDQSRPVSKQSRLAFKEQQSQAKDSGSFSSTSSQTPFQVRPSDKCQSGANRGSVLSSMLQSLAFVSSQQSVSSSLNIGKSEQFHHVSDLPTAYYSGTAPNVDLTKAPFALACLPTSMASQSSISAQQSRSDIQLEAYFTELNSQLDRRLNCTSGNQDELDETLNVLKSLDSQYFQHDDDSNNPETAL